MTADDPAGGPRYKKMKSIATRVARPGASVVESALGAITDALFVYDVDGQLVHMNAAARQLLGLAPDDAAYATLSRQARLAWSNMRGVDGAPLAGSDWPLDRLLRGEVITAESAVDLLLTQPDGAEKLVAFTGAPIRDADGNITGAVSVGRDETRRHRLEDDLRAVNTRLAAAAAALTQQADDLELTNRRMDQFLGMANHELKTPLTSLSANLQLAARRVRRLASEAADDASAPASAATTSHDAEAILASLTRAQNATRRMTRLVNELLDVSRIQTGRMEAHPEPCDLLALTRSVIAELRQTHPERVVLLETTDDVAPALADSDRISEVIDNYLSNAAKYSPADTPITVALTLTDDGSRRVSVRDEGQGIAPATQSRIWNVFERLDSDAAQRASGVNLGLGLHICKTIIALHGGEVGVESAPGAGSTFWFTLPAAPGANR